jgi:cell division protein DivIC
LLSALVNLNRVITSFYIVLFVGLGLTAAFLFLEAKGEYNSLRKIEVASRQRLAEKEAQLREQEKILERMRTDPAYVERVIRRRLGYARPDQTIFRFQD